MNLPLYEYPLSARSVCLTVFCSLAGCGGSGGSSPPPPPPPATVSISVSDAAVDEGDAGSVDVVFGITLSGASSSDITIDYTTSDNSAIAGVDYVAANGTLTISAGSTSTSILVVANGDTEAESDEEFTLTLSNPSANATLGAATATGLIRDDDVDTAPSQGVQLNDTGVTGCSNGVANELACNDTVEGTSSYPGQDAEFGRDVTANADIDGHAGFVFSKLDENGVALGDQAAEFNRTPWACVADTVTGLTWETKSNDGGRHDAAWTYSWYDDTGFATRATLGDPKHGACELEEGCDSGEFLARVNSAGLCGFNDWRLPTRSELLSIVDFGRTASPLIDTDYFPNTFSFPYWSATPTFVGGGWLVDMKSGNSGTDWFFNAYAVRLVRGGF